MLSTRGRGEEEKKTHTPSPSTHTSFSVTRSMYKQYCLLFTDDVAIPYERAFISSYADPCGSVFAVQDNGMATEKHNGVK